MKYKIYVLFGQESNALITDSIKKEREKRKTQKRKRKN